MHCGKTFNERSGHPPGEMKEHMHVQSQSKQNEFASLLWHTEGLPRLPLIFSQQGARIAGHLDECVFFRALGPHVFVCFVSNRKEKFMLQKIQRLSQPWPNPKLKYIYGNLKQQEFPDLTLVVNFIKYIHYTRNIFF
jgi:hypothetical protein